MLILLIANYRYDRQESMQRYADMMESGLRERGVDVAMIRPEPYFGRFKPAGHGLGKWLGYIDKFIIFPIRLRWLVARIPGVIVHICDHSNSVYCKHLRKTPHLVTCHDLLAVRSALGHFSQNRLTVSGRLYQKWILSGLKQAHTVVCDSDATRRDLLALGRRDDDTTRTVYLSLNHPYMPMDERTSAEMLRNHSSVRDLGPGGYLFHVGGAQWYKNREGLLRIYFHYIRQGGRLPLVLAGKPPTLAMQALLAQAPEGAQVLVLAGVKNSELNALYARAACLVFPSLYEGFGWPVLEALSVGCPVMCSPNGSLSEVGGSLVQYIDPLNESEAASVLAQALVLRPSAEDVKAHLELFTRAVFLDGMQARYQALAN